MLNYFITNYGTQIIGIILCAIFGCLGYAVKKLCARYINDDTKATVARTAAKFVEQVFTDIHGKYKLHKALETAEALLKKKGIPFDADEMEVLIEAAVAEFNEAFKKTTAAIPDDTTNSAGTIGGFDFPALDLNE